MKKRNLLIIVFLLCLFALPSQAQTQGDFSYTVSGGSAKITAYSGSAEELTLPDTLGGYPVTAIGVCALRNCRSLTRVVIPHGVTQIGSNAFQNCVSLAEIVIPQSVTRIDTHAFYGCSSLRQIDLHDNLDRVNVLAFYGCSAVRYCALDSQSAYVLSDHGYTFTSPDYPQLALMAYEDGEGQRTFTVAGCDPAAVSVSFPDGVTAIDGYAFYGCSALSSLSLPHSVTTIKYSAFEGCSSLRQIVIPASVTQIDSSAFSGCADLTIFAPVQSAAHAFALENGFVWQPL